MKKFNMYRVDPNSTQRPLIAALRLLWRDVYCVLAGMSIGYVICWHPVKALGFGFLSLALAWVYGETNPNQNNPNQKDEIL